MSPRFHFPGFFHLLLCGLALNPGPAVSAEEKSDKRKELHLYMKGRYLFQKNCTVCHGDSGKGDGPWAAGLKDKPRNFRTGVFKFRTTPYGMLPAESDLRRTIRNGISGTAMPFFEDLTDEDVGALIVYLRNLSRNWKDAALKADPIPLPDPPQWLNERNTLSAHAGKGAELFAIHCASCHGTKGKGDGPAGENLVDLWENKIVPADLSAPHHKSGDKPDDLYRTIATGLNGTPMVGFHGMLDEESIWNLVAFIETLDDGEKPD